MTIKKLSDRELSQKLMYANGGKKLFNNAKDCIASNGKFTNELNEDIVAWVKSWRHK